MAAGIYHFYIEQGARFVRTFTIEDDGDPRVLTDYDARVQVRRTFGSSTTIAEWTVDSGHITIDEPAGIVTLEVPADETADLPRASGVYDLELIPPTGEGDADRLLQGFVSISPEVTRDASP